MNDSQGDQTFGQKNNLNSPVRAVHEHAKPFTCLICSKTFGQKGNLNTHVKTVHEKVKPFTCLIC